MATSCRVINVTPEFDEQEREGGYGPNCPTELITWSFTKGKEEALFFRQDGV